MVLPRVSQIIAPYSGYSKIPKKILEKAASRGTIIHEACLAMVTKQTYNLPVEYTNYLLSFSFFLPKIENVISHEQRIEDEEWKYSGMYDYIGEVRGYPDTTLFDIKTSHTAKKIWGCQLAAYSRLCDKYLKIKPTTIMVVHLCKEGKPPKIIEYDCETYLSYFRSMCDMYHLFKPDEPELLYD